MLISVYTTEGIILKKTDSGEADALFTIYTKDFGKIRAVAQGVKKENAKLKGHLEPLSLSVVSFVLGKNTPRLTHATLMHFWSFLREDIKALKAAYHVAAAIDAQCLEGERDSAVWELLCRGLTSLNNERNSPEDIPESVRLFEEQLVESLGYGKGGGLQVLKFNP